MLLWLGGFWVFCGLRKTKKKCFQQVAGSCRMVWESVTRRATTLYFCSPLTSPINDRFLSTKRLSQNSFCLFDCRTTHNENNGWNWREELKADKGADFGQLAFSCAGECVPVRNQQQKAGKYKKGQAAHDKLNKWVGAILYSFLLWCVCTTWTEMNDFEWKCVGPALDSADCQWILILIYFHTQPIPSFSPGVVCFFQWQERCIIILENVVSPWIPQESSHGGTKRRQSYKYGHHDRERSQWSLGEFLKADTKVTKDETKLQKNKEKLRLLKVVAAHSVQDCRSRHSQLPQRQSPRTALGSERWSMRCSSGGKSWWPRALISSEITANLCKQRKINECNFLNEETKAIAQFVFQSSFGKHPTIAEKLLKTWSSLQ